MAKDETKRISPSVLEADKAAYAALQAVAGYAPANPTYAKTAIASANTDFLAAQTAETQAAAAAANARDAAVAKEWQFHNLILGAKDQVIAQFGRDSAEAQSLGLKKPSEYKSRARKAKTS
jgi:hypothetical protein